MTHLTAGLVTLVMVFGHHGQAYWAYLDKVTWQAAGHGRFARFGRLPGAEPRVIRYVMDNLLTWLADSRWNS